MKFLGNIPGVLCTLLTLAPVGLSLPRVLDVTAEDFMKMKEIKVRDGRTSLNETVTGTERIPCGGCTPSYSYKLVGDGDPHQNFVIT